MKQPPRVKPATRTGIAFLILSLQFLLLLAACGSDPTAPISTTPVERQQFYNTPIAPTTTIPAIQPLNPTIATTVAGPVTTSAAKTTASAATTVAAAAPIAEGVGASSGVTDQTILANAQVSFLQGGNLWVSDDKGGNRRQLTQTSNITSDKVFWSPSHDKVAIFDKREGILVFELNGRRTSAFRPDPSYQLLNSAAWSPDGRYLGFDLIAFSRDASSSPNYSLATDGEIYVIDTQQNTPQGSYTGSFSERPVLPQRLASGFNFVWSPDGKQIAYATRARRLAVMEFVPTQPLATTSGTPTNGSPTASTTARPAATPTFFPVIRPSRPATTTSPNDVTAPTPNPYYNAPQALVPFDNGLAIMNVTDRRENVLVSSGQIPAYPSPDNNAYPTENTAVQLISWSPDGRTLAFSDRISYIGTISNIGGTPRMLFGQPRAFSLNKLFWIPDSTNALLVLWNSYPGDERTLMGVLASPGIITSAVSDRVSCPALAPNGTMLAYLSGDDTQIVRTDGITLGVISGGGCPNWSPDSTLLITSRKASDGAIVLTNPKGQVVRLLLGTRAVEQVFWFKPN